MAVCFVNGPIAPVRKNVMVYHSAHRDMGLCGLLSFSLTLTRVVFSRRFHSHVSNYRKSKVRIRGIELWPALEADSALPDHITVPIPSLEISHMTQMHGRMPARGVRVEVRAVDNLQSVRDDDNLFTHEAIKARARQVGGNFGYTRRRFSFLFSFVTPSDGSEQYSALLQKRH
jgi:hypothetical protein